MHDESTPAVPGACGIMLTPFDPTAALAALIAGNQRHVSRRAEGREPSISQRIAPRSTKPFALVVELERLHGALGDLFDVSAEQVQSIVLDPGSGSLRSGRFEVLVPSEDELARMVDGSVATLGCSLVVVLARLKRLSSSSEIGFREIERRCLVVMRQLLMTSASLPTGIRDGRLRIVGALVDEQDGRVHWLGEHPEQPTIVQANP